MKVDLLQMSHDEKLRTMHEIWEDLARDEHALESPAWHEQTLRETAERRQSGGEGVHDWAEAKRELRRRTL